MANCDLVQSGTEISDNPQTEKVNSKPQNDAQSILETKSFHKDNAITTYMSPDSVSGKHCLSKDVHLDCNSSCLKNSGGLSRQDNNNSSLTSIPYLNVRESLEATFNKGRTQDNALEPTSSIPSRKFTPVASPHVNSDSNQKTPTENLASLSRENCGNDPTTTYEQSMAAEISSTHLTDQDQANLVVPTKPEPKSGTARRITKRKYSKNGCTECKRRRMKCDESKPSCWQCSRLNRSCVYLKTSQSYNKKAKTSHKEQNGEDQKSLFSEPLKDTSHVFDKVVSCNNTSVISPTVGQNSSRSPSHVNTHKSVSNLPNLFSAETGITLPSMPQEQQISNFQSNLYVDESSAGQSANIGNCDANLLMQNLNDIVNMKLHDSFLLNNDELDALNLPDLDIPELMPSNSSSTNSVPISFLVNNIITFNTKLSTFRLGGIHDQYMKCFYYDCLDSIAPFFQDQGNPLRDILLSFAKNESYLLSAILAIGASISYRQTEQLEDERNYCAYLSHCLTLLEEQFSNEANVLTKIEPIILTVIILAWDCIYTMNSQWRTHLQGVTDLLKKITSGNSSKVLNVAKCWFKVMETFASISTVMGGALVDEADIDIIFDPYDAQYLDSLRFLNIMTPVNEFNLIRGHREDFDFVIRDVIKALNGIRSTQKNYYSQEESGIFNKNIDYLIWSPETTVQDLSASKESSLSFFKTQKILAQIDRQLEYEFFNKTGVIPRTSSSHPRNGHIDDNAIDLVTLRSGEEIAISWYDISHQTQVLSFLLIVLLKLLGIPKESIIIQEVVRKIMSYFKFLDSDNPPKNLRTCYSNFAVLIAGLNAIDEETRNMVRMYYKLNGDRFRRLTEHNLNRLEKVWYGIQDEDDEERFNSEDDENESENISSRKNSDPRTINDARVRNGSQAIGENSYSQHQESPEDGTAEHFGDSNLRRRHSRDIGRISSKNCDRHPASTSSSPKDKSITQTMKRKGSKNNRLMEQDVLTW